MEATPLGSENREAKGQAHKRKKGLMQGREREQWKGLMQGGEREQWKSNCSITLQTFEIFGDLTLREKFEHVT